MSFRAPFSSNWSKAQHESLASALDSAWRRQKKDYSVGDITYQRKVVINNDELIQAFTLLDNLAREQPKPQPYELAERVIQELGKQQP